MIMTFFKDHKIISVVGVMLVAIYFISMIVYPVIQSSGNWEYIQKVWHRWQSLNAAMIALLITVSAIVTSLVIHQHHKDQEKEERQRNFIANAALLPQVLVDLTDYCTRSMDVYVEALKRANERIGVHKEPLETLTPPLPTSHIQVFKECIFYADQKVSEKLAYVLKRLQVHHSCMEALKTEIGPQSTWILDPANTHAYIYRLSEIHTWLNRFLVFSRGDDKKITDEENKFNNSSLVWNDFNNIFFNRPFLFDSNPDLIDFFERAIARNTHE